MRQKKSSPKTKPIILGDEINYRVKGLSVLLEVETESHFQSELRTVFIYIPINGRFNGYRTRQEERVTAFQTEAETGFVTAVPVITVQVDVSSEENAYFVDIITSAHTQGIDIRPAALPLGAGIYQQGYIIHQKRTAFGFKAEMRFVRFRIIRKVESGNGRIYEPFSFFKLRVGSHSANKQAYE